MTSIMGFYVDGGTNPVYLCSDSQSTGAEKRANQKLFMQGRNLFTSTGNREYILRLRQSVYNTNPEITPKELAETFLAKAKEFNVDKKDPRNLQDTFIAGLEDGKSVLYDVSIFGDPNSEPHYRKIDSQGLILSGSGSSQTGPAVARDYETKNMKISDVVEGMNLCFSLG